jgi:energy-coupling factor transport system permease protein
MNSFLFQVVERRSFFTHLDFRSKFFAAVVLTIIAFTWESPFLQGCLVASLVLASLAAGVRIQYMLKLIIIMLPFNLFMLLSHGFFNVVQVKSLTGQTALTSLFSLPPSWWLVGGMSFSLEGALYGINVICKTLSLTLVLPLAILTSDLDAMIVGLVQAHIPYKIAFIFSSTMRFFPLLFQEAASLIETQRLRGLAYEEMGLFKRVGLYAQIAIPLILNAMVRSQQIEVVLQSKAFSGNPDRSYLHNPSMNPADYAVIIVSSMILLAAAILYFTIHLGQFAGPI